MNYSLFFIKKNTGINNRKGIVMFIVVGALLVLSVLVVSYNYLVLGKSSESKEILRHIRAEKCAQAVCRYVISHLICDLNNSSKDNSLAVGYSIKKALFEANTADKLKERLTKDWLVHLQYKEVYDDILKDTTSGVKPEPPLVELGFTDIHSLNSLKSSKGIGDDVFYFDQEKIGLLTVRVTVEIERSSSVWQETRPFKVIFPFPVPITKFNLYWNDGPDDPFSFNTVSIKSDSGESANGKNPFLIDNGTEDKANSNDNEDVWMDRGWIYIGGNGLFLNRARGIKRYGQYYHSYSVPEEPLTLMMNFPDDSGGDGWNKYLYNGERLGFRIAYWGFSESLTTSTSNKTWQMILKFDYDENPPGSKQNNLFWDSSSLHLFSQKNIFKGDPVPSNFVPTITRVVGKVYDRYLEMGYLLPVNSDSEALFAAVIGLSKDEYNSLKEEREYSSNKDNYTFENYLFFSEGYDFDSDKDKKGADALQEYFEKLPYSVQDSRKVDYYKVMSKTNYRSMDETYNIIAQYSKNSEDISIPPTSSVPDVTDYKFSSQNKYTSRPLKKGIMPDEIMNLDISEIGKTSDSTLGLSLKTCYKITGSSSGIENILKANFGTGSDLNLNNLVYKVKADDGSVKFTNLRIHSAGSIYSEGPITVGPFMPNDGDEYEAPIMLLAEKGSITVNNYGNNAVRAYLVALGEGGTVKTKNTDAPLFIRGGMAVKEFKPENIPNKGGYLEYNYRLDPLEDSFVDYLGVAIGPKGGKP